MVSTGEIAINSLKAIKPHFQLAPIESQQHIIRSHRLVSSKHSEICKAHGLHPVGTPRPIMRILLLILGPPAIVAASYGLTMHKVGFKPQPMRLSRLPLHIKASPKSPLSQTCLLDANCRQQADSIRQRLDGDCHVIARPPWVLAGDFQIDELDRYHLLARHAHCTCAFDDVCRSRANRVDHHSTVSAVKNVFSTTPANSISDPLPANMDTFTMPIGGSWSMPQPEMARWLTN